MKTKPEPVPITYSADLEPGTAELTTELNGHDFVIRGDEEELNALAQSMAAEAARPARTNKVASVAIKAAVEPPKPRNQYVDYSELPTAQVARMKLRSRVYDALHRTSMTDRLIERINEDRDLAFARSLGLIGVTHCQKHEKAVAKLRGLTV